MSAHIFAICLCFAILTCVTGRSNNRVVASDERNVSNQVRNFKAKDMLKYMSLQVDPCQDFYGYACGNWSQYHRPERNEVLTVQNLLEAEVIKQLKTILDGNNFLRDSSGSSKASNFYRSCLEVDRTSTTRRDFLLNFVKLYGGLAGMTGTNWRPGLNWIQIIAKLRANIGIDVLIGLEIDKNLHNGRGNSIFLTEPKNTLIPADLCSAIAAQDADLKDKAYENIQQEVANNMITWFSLKVNDANRFAGDIIAFEFQLCKKMRNDHTWRDGADGSENEEDMETRGMRGQSRLHGNRGNLQLYPRQSLQYWTQHFNNVIDFKLFINTIFEKPINDQVYMTSEVYFQHLARVIKMSALPTLSNYIMYRALTTINFPNPDTIPKRPEYCVKLTLRYFTKIIGAYLQRFYRGETRDDIDFVFRQTKNVLEDSVRADWMDENTKNSAIQKLIPFKVGYPNYDNIAVVEGQFERLDYWHKLEAIMNHNAKNYLERLYNVEITSFTDYIEASDVRIKIFPAESEIIIGWGILQAPLYNYYFPNSLKFSVLGQNIARELAFAFDEQGWQDNGMSPQRLHEYAAEGFHNQSECFRSQYSNYLYNNPNVFQNASKIREIMADSSGLNIAFKAYLKWMESMDPTEYAILRKETLPELNFSNTQLFFLHFAQTRCMAKYDDVSPPNYLPMAKRSADRYFVNGPLSNNEEFAREFGCERGIEMNPDDKCVLYA